MTAQLSPTPVFKGWDNNGAPLAFGKLYSYIAGTSTPQATYTDYTQSTPNTNPIILNARGECALWLDPALSYKLLLQDSTGNTIPGWPVDQINGALSPSASVIPSVDNVYNLGSATNRWANAYISQQIYVGLNNYPIYDSVNGIVGYYARTAAEIAASVTPTNYGYAPGNVLRYGADKTGAVDSSTAFNSAAACLDPTQPMYVPTGTYLIDNACVRVTSKAKCRIYGDGTGSVIKQSNPGLSGARVTWHSNMVIDQCSDITIENLVFEAKGSQYGDVPGVKPGTPDLVVASIANEWGMPLAITRCTSTIWVRNVLARYPGDNACFYASSCERVVFEQCFANAASLSYAGFNVDNYANSALTGRTYKFIDCMVWAESTVPAGLSSTYGSKGGVVAEGDNTKVLNITVLGGNYRDGAEDSSAITYGTGLTITDSNCTVNGVSINNCYIGIRLNKRGGTTDTLRWSVDGCSMTGCLVSGIYTNIQNTGGGGTYSINACDIDVASTSVWSAQTGTPVQYSSGICHDGFMSGILNITGCEIFGAQRGYYCTDLSRLTMSNCRISTLDYGIYGTGGGTYKLNGNSIETSNASSVPIFITTINVAGGASGSLGAYINNNFLNPQADTTSDYALQLSGNSALYTAVQVKGNDVAQGILNFAKGSATFYDVDPIMLQTTQRVIADGLSTTNTYIQVTMPKEYLLNYAYAVGSDDVSRAIISQTNNKSGTRGLYECVVSTDVRTQYNATNFVRVTLMQ